MEASHEKHRPHIKVGKDAEEEEEDSSYAWPEKFLRLACAAVSIQTV